MTIAEAARAIVDAFGFGGRLVFDTSKADGQYKKTASNAKLKSILPEDFKFTPFYQAIKETVVWFKANQKTARM